jgi:asparagine synthase (glutamine-hydrolysing)
MAVKEWNPSRKGLNMSGIYGFAVQHCVSDPKIVLKKMREAVPAYGPLVNHQWTSKDGDIGLETLHPTRIGQCGRYAEDRSTGVYCIFDGVIYRASEAAGGELVEPNGAALLLEHYLSSGTEGLDKIDGSFNVAWWDERVRCLVLANDKLSHRPLFFGYSNGNLVFASLLANIMATGMISPEVDVEGLADLITYQYILGKRTLFKDILILPPASVLTYKEGRLSIKQYWCLDHVEPYGKYDKRRLDRLAEVFKTAVRRSLRLDLTCAVGLTGGLDSRCILAAAANQQLPFVTHTGGQPDSTDVVLANEIADRAEAPHIFEPITPDNLGEWLVPMVLHQGAIIATLHSHPCQLLYSQLPFDAIVQGLGGEFVRGFWVSPSDLKISDLATQKPRGIRRLLSKTTQYPEKLWNPVFRSRALHAPKEHLNDLLSDYNTQDVPVAAVEYLYVNERCRKFLNKAILIARANRDAYFPFLDHQWMEEVASIPISERLNNRIQIDLIKRLYPKILDIPYAKNLIPLSASPGRIRVINHYRGIKQRLSRKLKFMGPDHIIVPTHYYSQWTRSEMRSMLIELLYNPNAAFRAYLDWETVETLLGQHFSRQKNYESLLGALAVFEIAHQLWVNPSDKKDSSYATREINWRSYCTEAV